MCQVCKKCTLFFKKTFNLITLKMSYGMNIEYWHWIDVIAHILITILKLRKILYVFQKMIFTVGVPEWSIQVFKYRLSYNESDRRNREMLS